MKCEYCGNEYKNLPAHARWCKARPAKQEEKPQAEIKPAEALPFQKKTIAEPEKKPKRTLFWGYSVVTILMVLAALLQYFVFDFFKINKWLLIPVFIFDLIIWAFIIWTIWRLRAKAQMVVFDTVEKFLEAVPKWSLDEKAPNKGLIGSVLNVGKEYKQIVLVSKNFEPKKIWSEWNGFQFSIGNRAYKPPNGSIRGDVFFYNKDTMTPLIDTVEPSPEDAEDSFQLDAVWNQGVAVGHAAAMSTTQKQIQLILILMALTLVSIVIYALYSYGQFTEIHKHMDITTALATNTSEMILNGR